MKIMNQDDRLQNPQRLHENRLPPRASVIPARHADVFFRNKEESELIQVLNSNFRFCYREKDDLPDFFEEGFPDTDWDVLPVPSMWQYHGYGTPAYPNVEYPIPFQPPYVCCANPVGYYRKRFISRRTERTILYFGGVDNAFFVYLNGEYVGFSKGSRLPAEFDVSQLLRDGENLLCVKVFSYSDATYLENQDMLLANGIFRDVMLYHLGETTIWDYYVRTEEHSICIDVCLQGEQVSTCTVIVQADGQRLERQASAHMAFSFEIENPKPWNAEAPQLYSVSIELQRAGVCVELHTKKIGFAHSSIEGNRLLLNGAPITLKGVNRHEHDPKNGRAVTVSMIERELRQIKACGMNAIRCAHYPNHPAFYELASELGLYVMDEGDLETHGCLVTGDQGYLSKQPQWLPAYMDRTVRAAERNKNETCIIIRSIGNEHGRGENIDRCADYLRQVYVKKPVWVGCDDPKHPVSNDFREESYFTLDSLMSYEEAGKPVLLLEYGHAMGNSPGLMADSWNYIYEHPHIIGGFLWEWKNHGFYAEDAQGNVFYRYGGDFGDVNHWGNFCLDGYCLSDGTPKPALLECRHIFAPVHVTLASGQIQILNTNDFSVLDDITVSWSLCADGDAVRCGQERLPALAPHAWMVLPIRTQVDMPIPGAQYTVDLTFFDGQKKEIAKKQVLLPVRAEKRPFVPQRLSARLMQEENQIIVQGEDFRAAFENGLLCTYIAGGRTLLRCPMRLNIFRAPTDNDGVVNCMPRWIRKWEEKLLPSFAFGAKTVTAEQSETEIAICAEGIFAPTGRYIGFSTTIRYRIYYNGYIHITITGEPYGEFCEVLPRLGVVFELDKAFGTANWYGRGPGESYADRKDHCMLGHYSLPVGQMNFLYDVPQECGNREDTAFVTVSDGQSGLSVIGAERFAFSYQDFTLEELARARHRNELKKAEQNYLYLDYRMRGLGSYSCGPNPEECYELRAHTFQFAFTLAPQLSRQALTALWRQHRGEETAVLSGTYRYEAERQAAGKQECDVDRE